MSSGYFLMSIEHSEPVSKSNSRPLVFAGGMDIASDFVFWLHISGHEAVPSSEATFILLFALLGILITCARMLFFVVAAISVESGPTPEPVKGLAHGKAKGDGNGTPYRIPSGRHSHVDEEQGQASPAASGNHGNTEPNDDNPAPTPTSDHTKERPRRGFEPRGGEDVRLIGDPSWRLRMARSSTIRVISTAITTVPQMILLGHITRRNNVAFDGNAAFSLCASLLHLIAAVLAASRYLWLAHGDIRDAIAALRILHHPPQGSAVQSVHSGGYSGSSAWRQIVEGGHVDVEAAIEEIVA